MSNHIPGPLYAIDGLIYKDFGDTRYKIAEVDPYVWDDVESTAQLLAAAPELLEALKTFMDYNEQGGPLSFDTDAMWARARAAIAKAERQQQ